MSLSVYLESETPFKRKPTSGIFIRENGATREISREEWDKRNPGREPGALRVLDEETTGLYHRNITHNLNAMARAAGIYQELWRPEALGITHASHLIAPLVRGLAKLEQWPVSFKALNPENGWGTYEDFVEFVADYLQACAKHPEARVKVSV